MNKIALAIHGGAGTILKSLMTEELEREYRGALQNALQTGWNILQNGGNALDAVEAATVELENFYLFNAGKGSVFTHAGKNEMDACLMNGKTLRAGAVAFVRHVKNPIKLARLVMEKTPHVLLAGEGANEFAQEMSVEFEADDYFRTEFRYQQLLTAREKHRVQLDHTIEEPEIIEEVLSLKPQVSSLKSQVSSPKSQVPSEEDGKNLETSDLKLGTKSLGTVGAVACDKDGNVAAATSTGGMTNKKFGRVGDTPIVGLGTYADNQTCAVSCTGHGEFFMLGVTAYDVAARMKYKNLGIEQAAQESIDYLTQIGGEGGLIAVDARGNIVLPFNSEGMYRGYVATDGEFVVEIYK
jgi:beta-aspartyl-peptidase (threonine type)